ncbi:MAG: hypothetical protein RIC16_02475 [Rhodospirillales bacterium]
MTEQTTPANPAPGEHREHWLRRSSSIRLMWRGGIVVLALLALLDLVVEPHPHFGIDGTFGFYSWYGLLTCVAMVVVAKGLGIFLKRPDDYYDD